MDEKIWDSQDHLQKHREIYMTDEILSDHDLDIIFREARSFKGFQDKPVSEITLRAVYDLVRWGPTAFNCSPARLVMVQSEEAKTKLADCAMDSNKGKIINAPVTIIVGYDLDFYKQLPALFKGFPGAKDIYEGNAELARETAFRNGSLQGGYMIVGARALGLDCCPMSGFDNGAVDAAFFSGTAVKSNFICGMGYGDRDSLPDRDDRPSFDEVCQII